MHPVVRDIEKIELQKLLDVGFIYPILENQGVSPLVIVPNKGCRWRVCADYRELNTFMRKDHFPLPFIDQVLDSLVEKKYLSFIDGFNGYNYL